MQSSIYGPSFLACLIFYLFYKQRITAIPRKEKSEHIGFLDMIGMSDSFSDSKDHMDVQVTEVNGPAAEDDSSISLTTLGEICQFSFINMCWLF